MDTPEITADMFIAHIEAGTQRVLNSLKEYRESKQFTDLEMLSIEEHAYAMINENNETIKRIKELKDE